MKAPRGEISAGFFLSTHPVHVCVVVHRSGEKEPRAVVGTARGRRGRRSPCGSVGPEGGRLLLIEARALHPRRSCRCNRDGSELVRRRFPPSAFLCERAETALGVRFPIRAFSDRLQEGSIHSPPIWLLRARLPSLRVINRRPERCAADRAIVHQLVGPFTS
jgi:hypothetical protein